MEQLPEVTADDFRRRGSSILDRVMLGETLAVTRNTKALGVIMPMAVFHQLTSVSIRDLARTLGVSVSDILPAMKALINEHGRESVVYQEATSPGHVLLYARAATAIQDHLAGG